MPDVEGGISAARKERWSASGAWNYFKRLALRAVFFRRAGKPGATAGKDARRYNRSAVGAACL
jgi:hypothetical protein